MNDIILDYLEEADAHFELSFVANGEVVKCVKATDIDEILSQSRKLEGADIEWATEELAYAQHEFEVGAEEGVQ